MKDFLGNELQIGDDVVFILRSNTFANLKVGKIREIKRGYAYVDCKWNHEDEHWIKWGKGLSSISIMKVGAQVVV